jgi:hypothetical protein
MPTILAACGVKRIYAARIVSMAFRRVALGDQGLTLEYAQLKGT